MSEINKLNTEITTWHDMISRAHELKEKIKKISKKDEHGFEVYGNNILVTYDKNFNLKITITFNTQPIYIKQFNLALVQDFDEFIEKVIKEIKEFLNRFDELFNKYKDIMSAIPTTPREMIYNNWVHGKCKYASLGHTRYAYVGVNAPGTYTQWVRVFFNREEILWDKTRTELKTDREQRMNQTPVGRPPDVQFIFDEYADKTIEFLRTYEKDIFDKLTALPLNKSDLKESTAINMLLLVSHGDKMVIAGNTEICDPNAELYLFAIIENNWYQRSVKGYCKRIDGSEDIYEVTTFNHGPVSGSSDTEFVTTLYSTTKVQAYKAYKLGQKMTDLDEYVKNVIDEAVKEWRAKNE